MHNFVHDMLHASPAALRIEALWKVRPPGLLLTPPSTSMRRRGLQEYEQGATPEAKFVKDLDRLEMALQGASSRIGAFAPDVFPLFTAREYEKAHGRDRGDLQGFFDSSLPYLRHPEVRRWGDRLASERDRDVDGRGGA